MSCVVTTPKFARLVVSRVGSRNVGWLNALKKSNEYSTFSFSRKLVTFPRRRSTFLNQKPRSGRERPVVVSEARRMGRNCFKAAAGSLKQLIPEPSDGGVPAGCGQFGP